jgi:hypothetical protein
MDSHSLLFCDVLSAVGYLRPEQRPLCCFCLRLFLPLWSPYLSYDVKVCDFRPSNYQRTDYMGWKFDVTTQIMVMVQRVTAFAFNYYDGAANPGPREMPDKGFFEKTNGIKKLPGYSWL